MEEKRSPAAQNAWEIFSHTGQVIDYLAYCRAAQTSGREEASDANQNTGAHTQGTEYR